VVVCLRVGFAGAGRVDVGLVGLVRGLAVGFVFEELDVGLLGEDADISASLTTGGCIGRGIC
jgi:hypothetical protein